MSTLTSLLALTRIGTGISLLITPRTILNIAHIASPEAVSGAVGMHFTGARDLALGIFLWRCISDHAAAMGRESGQKPTREGEETSLLAAKNGNVGKHIGETGLTEKLVKAALTTGVLVDGLDIVVCAGSYLEGSMGLGSALSIGGVALVALAWGLQCMKIELHPGKRD